MSSGKQLSFKYGEVSPSLRYKSDAVTYSQGLSKLRNMYVRKEGGVSNRPGFEFVQNAVSQYNIPEKGEPAGIKSFVYWCPNAQAWRTITLYYDSDEVSLLMKVDNIDVTGFGGFNPVTNLPPHLARFTVAKDKVFITPEHTHDSFGSNDIKNGAIYPYDAAGTAYWYDSGYAAKTAPYVVGSAAYTTIGKDPYLRVSYLVTIELTTGEEVILDNRTSSIPVPPTGTIASTTPVAIAHPHADLQQNISITIATAFTNVKTVNFYRASGQGGIAGSFYRLVGKTPYNGQTTMEFTDFGQDFAAITPPLDESAFFYSKNGGGSGFILGNTGPIRGVVAAAYYQQRLICLMKPNITPAIKTGDVLASKIGAPEQLKMPMIYTDTGAFIFSVPITDGSPPVAALAMERLIIFTQRGVYAVRGGEQGILTPTQVNPLLISEEGCSLTVEPKMSGKRGFFINNAHTKLMAINFSVDGNLEVMEVSAFADHLMKDNVVEIEAISDTEDSVYMVTAEGKLIRVTINPDGEAGFSTIDTQGGYVESIYRGKALPAYVENYLDTTKRERYVDVLMAYIIRGGVRRLERLNPRRDESRQVEAFADAHFTFGRRLAANGAAGYKQIVSTINPVSSVVLIPDAKLNIEAAGGWDANTVKTIRCSQNVTLSGEDFKIIFFYNDDDGKEQRLSFVVDPTSEATISDGIWIRTFTGYFEQDIPAVLQNVRGKTGLSDAEKNRRYTRWLPAAKRLTGTIAGFGVDSINLGALATAIVSTFENPTFFPEGTVIPCTIVADGEIISNPANPNRESVYGLLSDGLNYVIDLPDYFCNGYIGIPYVSEFESLDIETADARTLTSAKKLINKVGMGVMETRGGFFGVPGKELTEMEELVYREDGDITQQTANKNGYLEVSIPSEWTEGGKVVIKNVDPVPMSILSIYPKGIAGD